MVKKQILDSSENLTDNQLFLIKYYYIDFKIVGLIVIKKQNTFTVYHFGCNFNTYISILMQYFLLVVAIFFKINEEDPSFVMTWGVLLKFSLYTLFFMMMMES